MILSAHQSHYLPWLGYLDKIDRADIFILLDDVQYEKNGWQNRNRILTPRGPLWLTVPVQAHLSNRLIDVKIPSSVSWQRDHSKSLEQNYHKAPHFLHLWHVLQGLYEKEWSSLVALNLASLEVILKAIGIEGKKRVCSSTLGITSQATQRLVDLCKHFKADTYLSGDGAAVYLDVSLFEKEGIRVEFQHFSHPVYPQLSKGGEKFVEGLSGVDLIFNQGKESLDILRAARKERS